MDTLTDGIKKLLLAGIGAAATGAEKSEEIVDKLVKKGELTVEQGKTLNEELKHNVKKTFEQTEKKDLDLDAVVNGLTPDQLKELKKKLDSITDDEASEA